MQGGFLTTHILDTANGIPAAGVVLRLYRIVETKRELITEKVTNDDGRTDSPILPKEDFSVGQYELEFEIGDYFAARNQVGSDPRFLDIVPIRFGINDPGSHYHVPLLASPYGYSTYRGS